MNHLTPEQLTGHLDGALDPRADAVVERHLAACVRCRVELASLASQDDRLRASLTHDPGEAYFETFADRVMERARSAARGPEVATFELGTGAREIARAPHRGFWDWLSPRGMAWAGSVAAVIAAAGLVFVTARERNVDHLRSPELIRRSEQAAPPVEATPASPAPNAASSEGALNDRDEALKKLQASADQEAPAEGFRAGVAGTGAKESERRDEASSTLGRPLAGADGKAQSAPSRMVEVQRAPNGEEVPVQKDVARGFAAPPAAQTPSAAPMGAVTVTKPRPQPMSESANEKNKQETGAASLDKAVRESSADTRQRKSANAAAPTPPSASAERGQSAPLQYAAPVPKAAVAHDALAPSAKDEVRRCGVVRDARGKGLAGAQVAIADLGRVATTDSAGRFCINAPAGLHTVSAYGLRFTPLRQDATFGSGEGELVLVVEPVSVLPEAKSVDSRAVLWPAAARTEASHALALEDSAARAPSANAYERVAQSWQRVLDIVPSGSGTSDARDHLAEARFRAWESAPTSARAQAARAALDAYLASAPAGARRTLAEQRRERLLH